MPRYPGHHVICNFSMAGEVENCHQCRDLELRDHSWYRRRELIRTGKYTEEIMAKAEEIFWAVGDQIQYTEMDLFRSITRVPAPRTHFETWLETPSAPTQSYFAKLAVLALRNSA